MKTLIVTADDLGLTEGVTDGIIEAHEHGIVTHTSIMPPGLAFDYAVRQLQSRKRLRAGVHLTLVEEMAVSDPRNIPSLVGSDGLLPRNYRELLRGVLLGRISIRDIETEIREQVQKCASAGLELTHVDSHQHVHVWPSILQVVLRVARDYGIPRVRLPRDTPLRRKTWKNAGYFSKVVLCGLAQVGALAGPADSLGSTERMLGLFESGHLTEQRLLSILQSLGDGTTELVCHPGNLDRLCRERYDHWGFDWRTELKALISAEVLDSINLHSIRLAR